MKWIVIIILALQFQLVQASLIFNDSIIEPNLKKELFIGSGFPYLPPINPNPWAYRIPALAVTNNGTLIAVCDRRNPTPADLPNDIDLVMRRSFDNGNSWTTEEVLLDQGSLGAGDAQLLVERNSGEIFMFFVEAFGQGINRRHRTYYMSSTDDGFSWSAKIRVDTIVATPLASSFTAGPGNGIQLTNGRLIVPVYGPTSIGGRITFFYSDDYGANWQLSQASGGPGLGEPTVVELVDGRLMFNCRNVNGQARRGTMYTEGNGSEWSEVVFDDVLIESEVQASFIRFTDTTSGYDKNRLLFSNPADENERKNLTIRISYDEGLTWEHSKVLYSDGAAYSSMVTLPDGDIAIFYEKDWRSHPPLGIIFPDKLNFERFTLNDLTNGADTMHSCTPPIPIVLSTVVVGNSAKLQWNTFYGGEYILEYKLESVSEWNVPGSIQPGFKLINLEDGRYHARVKWICKEGRSIYSTIDTFQVGVATGTITSELNEAQIFPNPTRSGTDLTVLSGSNIRHIELMDLEGRVIISRSVLQSNTRSFTLKLPQLNTGSYIMLLKTDDDMEKGTLIIGP